MPKENFSEKLTALLKTHPEFLDDASELILAAVRDHAWRLDHDLIKLLLTDEAIKPTFFDEINGHWVFNHNTFINYITDRNFLANSYTRFRNKIGLNIGAKFLRERGEVLLVWPYKDCVLEGGQTREEEKRKEIFFNEILAQDEINRLFDPKVLTNWKRHTIEGEQGGISESVNWQGGGDFIYCELMPYNQIYMDKIQSAQSSEELVALWKDIAENSFLNWYVNEQMPEAAVKDFIAIGDVEKQKHLLAELLDKNQLYVNLSEIEDADFAISKEDKALNKAFYGE